MFALYLIVILTVGNAVSSPNYPNWGYLLFDTENQEVTSDEEDSSSKEISHETNHYSTECLKFQHSLISRSDIQYLIDEAVERIQLKENLVNSSYPEAKQLRDEYLKVLEELREKFEDRPGHIFHIIESIANLRQNLEPYVEKIASDLQEFYVQEEKFKDIAEGSTNVLNQLEKYKRICQINCDNYDIDTRFQHNFVQVLSKSDNVFCVQLESVNAYIYSTLSQFKEQYEEVLHRDLESRRDNYDEIVTELKQNLKETAVKHFGSTMYDILSLQDDYYHFEKYLNNINISSEMNLIEENTAEIKLRLIGLKRDIEKYRQFCTNCYVNQRAKRDADYDSSDNTIHFPDSSSSEEYPDTSIEKTINDQSDIVSELLKAKIEEIKQTIIKDLEEMFEELDEDFSNPDLVDSYISNVQPMQHYIDYDIEVEQVAFDRLSNSIPESSIDNVRELSRQSRDMIQSLELAKQFIELNI